MLTLLTFSFLSGLVTILAPCIWPLLPIILSSSVASTGHKRPLGITLGIILSFSVFTLSLSTLVNIFHFDPNNLRFVAVFIIGALGLAMLVPALSARLELVVSRLSSRWGNRGQTAGGGFGAGFITGLSLGIVWAPCAGPILATIAVLAATGHVTAQVVAITFAYALGTGIPLFIFAYSGQKIIARSRSLNKYTGRIQQVFGFVMILTAVAIYTNYDKVVEIKLLNTFPVLSQSLSGFEQRSTIQKALSDLKSDMPTSTQKVSMPSRVIPGLFNASSPAPEVTAVNTWLNTNTAPTIASLRGKVVLVDFWTYTCINCIRTLPYVTNWYDKYKDQGFVVLGIHTPEFAFEKDKNNVLQAIKQFNIHYPVAQDNDYGVWSAFNNQYWPAEYLIDANGTVRRTHFGEGKYDEMEEAIQALLAEAGHAPTSTTLSDMPDQTPVTRISPETYLGTDRAQYYYPSGSPDSGTHIFMLPPSVPADSFALGGEWTIDGTQATAGDKANLLYHFTANKVYLVLRPGSTSKATVRVYMDGVLVHEGNAGADAVKGVVKVDQDRLYNLIDLQGRAGDHTLKLEFETPGTEAFAFTFG